MSGLRLCRGCVSRLYDDLRDIPWLYEECARVLDGSGEAGNQVRKRTTGGPLPGLPFNTTAADARSATLGLLASWTALVAEERRVSAPPRDVGSLAGFLSRHADWLAAHPAAGEASREIASAARWARQVAFGERPRRIRVGRCIEADCDGELVAVLDPRNQDSTARIACESDPGHAWTASQWLQLGRRMSEIASPAGQGRLSAALDERWLSVADIRALWNIAPGSVYRLASERGWRRRRLMGRTYYAADDVGDLGAGRGRTGSDTHDIR